MPKMYRCCGRLPITNNLKTKISKKARYIEETDVMGLFLDFVWNIT